jgi:hypothetical protein
MRERHASGTINALIRGYTLSVEFQQKLAASTQTEYRRMLTAARGRSLSGDGGSAGVAIDDQSPGECAEQD